MTDGPAPTGAPTAPPPAVKPPLRRPRDGRILGGVCLGIARHLGIDVVLVRIALVVLTIATGGLGAIAYVLGLLFIEAEDGTGAPATPASDPVRSREPLFYVGIGLLVVGVLVLLGGPLDRGVFGFGLRPGIVFPLVLIGFGIALWRSGDRRADVAAASVGAAPSAPTAAPGGASASAASTATQPRSWSDVPPTGGAAAAARPEEPTMQITPTEPTTAQTAPPSAAPSAPPADARPWQTSQQPSQASASPGAAAPGTAAPATPSTAAPGGTPPAGAATPGGTPPAQPPVGQDGGSFVPPPAPTRERSMLGRLTLGLALLTSGALWSLDLLGLTDLGMLRVVAAGMLVLGVGLLVGSIVGRARWLAIPGLLLAPLVLVGGLLPAGLVQDVLDGRRDGFGEVVQRPSTVAELDAAYELGAGGIRLDLTDLDLADLERAGGASTAVRVGAGEIVVLVPDDVAVEVTARSGAGEVLLFGSSFAPPSSGSGLAVSRSTTFRPDEDTPTVTLDLDVGLGVVEVRLVERSVLEPDDAEPEPGVDADPEPESGVDADPEPEPGADADADPEAAATSLLALASR